MKLTSAQAHALKTAAKDGSIIFGGIDATPGIRRDVVTRLAQFGFLVWQAPCSLNEESSWVLTAAGKAFVAKLP